MSFSQYPTTLSAINAQLSECVRELAELRRPGLGAGLTMGELTVNEKEYVSLKKKYASHLENPEAVNYETRCRELDRNILIIYRALLSVGISDARISQLNALVKSLVGESQ